MANYSIKNHPDDMTRNELIKKLGWPESSFKARMPRFLNAYKFSEKQFLDEKSNKMVIDYRIKDILFVLLAAFPEHPLERSNRNTNNITMQQVAEYNKTLVKLVEEIEGERKYSILQDPIYQQLVSKFFGFSQLTEKFNRLLTATLIVDKDIQTEIWGKLYSFMDELIFETFLMAADKKKDLEKQKQTDKEILKMYEQIKDLDEKSEEFQSVSRQIIAETTKPQVKPDSPFETIDGYLAYKLKSIMAPLDLRREDLEFEDINKNRELNHKEINRPEHDSSFSETAESLKKDAKIVNSMVVSWLEADAKNEGTTPESLDQKREMEWKQAVVDAAFRAKAPFAGKPSVEETCLKVWQERKKISAKTLKKFDYAKFKEFVDIIDKNNSEHLPYRLIREIMTETAKTYQKSEM